MKDTFEGKNWGRGAIDLTHLRSITEFRPTEIHMKEDGDLDDKPSFAIVLETNTSSSCVVGQLSLKMLNSGLKDVGYQITKIEQNV